ncbi:MAG: winged helix-turn-helix transcriptional regulator [Candidatus Thorarchaeota archaeon]
MDIKDKEIVFQLMNNCRQSYRDLSKKIDLSPSSIKKRVDSLIESGFIEEFVLLLNPSLLNLRVGNVVVHTDSSIPIDTFVERTNEVDGVYLIYPLISGNFYVGIEFTTDEEYDSMCKVIQSIEGVLKLEKYKMPMSDEMRMNPEVPAFNKNELKILRPLLDDPRMPVHEIAEQTGITLNRVRTIMEDFETGRRVLFSARWNPNLGRGLTFTSKVIYDESLQIDRFFEFLVQRYPLEYINSRNYESDSTMFSFFTVNTLPIMEQISQSILEYPGIKSCSTMIHYEAINRRPMMRLRLERMLEDTP